MTKPPTREAEFCLRFIAVLAAAYACVIVYVSLFPFGFSRNPLAGPFRFLFEPWPGHISGSDFLANVIAYVPLGMLIHRLLTHRRTVPRALLALSAGALLSLTMEILQSYIPQRFPSKVDLVSNCLGTLTGIIVSLLAAPQLRLPSFLVQPPLLPYRQRKVAGTAVLLWVLSQWSPWVPALDPSSIMHSIGPVYHTVQTPFLFKPARMLEYAAATAAIALLMRMIMFGYSSRTWILIVPAVTILAKPLFLGRYLSLEAISGLAIGLTAACLLANNRLLSRIIGILAISEFVLQIFSSGPALGQSFNWIPFARELDRPLLAFQEILETIWPFLAFGAMAGAIKGKEPRQLPWILGTPLSLIVVLGFEALAQFLGKEGDITPAILASAAWFFSSWWILSSRIEDRRRLRDSGSEG